MDRTKKLLKEKSKISKEIQNLKKDGNNYVENIN